MVIKKIIWILLILFSLACVNAVENGTITVGLNKKEIGVSVYAPPIITTIINYTQKNVNSSEYWDDLDSPNDIGLLGDFLNWLGDVLTFDSQLLNDTITILIRDNPTGNTTAEIRAVQTDIGNTTNEIQSSINNGNYKNMSIYWEKPVSDTGQVLHLPFTESNANDYSGEDNDGNIIGAIWNENGKIGGGMTFDGDSDYINCGNDDSFNVSTYTLSAWINFKGSAVRYYIFSNDRDAGNYNGYSMRLNSGFLQCITWNISGIGNQITESSFDFDNHLNEWHHVACNFDGVTTKGYIDGIEDGTDSYPPVILAKPTLNLCVGVLSYLSPNYYSFNGSIDEVGIWNRSLSSDEIKALYSINTEFYSSKYINKNKFIEMLNTNRTGGDVYFGGDVGIGLDTTLGNVGGRFLIDTNSADVPLRLVGKRIELFPDSYVHLSSALNQNMYYDCGGIFYWRDRDNANAVKMIFDSSNGRLGIGTSTPTHTLNVVGNTNITGNISYETIYTQLSDLGTQKFATAGVGYAINLSTTDEISGLTNNHHNITVLMDGVYNIVAQPQVVAGAGNAGDFHMWLQKHTSGSWENISNSNVELSLASLDSDVILLSTTISLNANELIRVMASVSDNGIYLEAQYPLTEPVIPSIIFTMFKLGN